MRCAIHSAENGSLMIIPRENKMSRLYIQLKEVTPDASGRADRSKITPETIFGAAKKIIAPYNLDYEYCDWWTAYQVFMHSSSFPSAHLCQPVLTISKNRSASVSEPLSTRPTASSSPATPCTHTPPRRVRA